ncbi:G-patch domain-containing protein [Heracleum sosnowskyi]|uniref:G-patch domain-containing protein n=1 Tax=Heracleum sosnowskyi TaxID=360622 RepID=A0AAD8ILP6_9APIA|nr:G-patch domain-containing protein [Heracleum sosnowskyi]
MAEEEDDYLGDLSRFLPPEPFLPPKHSSKKVSNKTLIPQSSNKKPKTINWQEQRKLKREKQQKVEDQLTLANIESAIPETNVGFKMLSKMGYVPGKALGKEGSGISEPVGIEIRRGRGGLGREDPETERVRREERRVVRERVSEKELMEEFGSRRKEEWRRKRVVGSFWKGRAVLDQLEGKEVVEEKKEEGEKEGEEEEEEEEVITEEDLKDVLMKLRDEFRYCLFCGYQYESTEALNSNCPGIDEDDH